MVASPTPSAPLRPNGHSASLFRRVPHETPSILNLAFALLAVVLAFSGACGSHPNPLAGATGSGGGEVTSGSLATGPGGGGGNDPVTTSSTSTGGSCKPGGTACQAFTECCSGACANQICTSCGGKGKSCAPDGCCDNGLLGSRDPDLRLQRGSLLLPHVVGRDVHQRSRLARLRCLPLIHPRRAALVALHRETARGAASQAPWIGIDRRPGHGDE